MSSQEHPVTMEKLLPDDVLTNIFTRLPAKLVARMRSLSKPFNALLSKPSFIKSHLHRSINNNDEILLVFYCSWSFHNKAFTTHPSRAPHLEYTNFIILPNNIPFEDSGDLSICSSVSSTVIGSVNGLICFIYLSYPTPVIHIWNPSLSALLPLPPYNITPESSLNVLFRFGFDPKTDDYKVVKLTFLLRPPNNENASLAFLLGTFLDVVKEWLQVEVYSMRKGCWEIITQRFPSHVTRILDQDEVYVDGLDGHLHWLGYIDDDRKLQTIVSFDLSLETFSEISLPDSLLDLNMYRRNSLAVLDGKLSLISCITDADCEVWVLNSESWVKHHVYSQFPGSISPFGFTLNNEFLFEARSRLALYDPIEAKVKLFNIMARILSTTKIVQYVDSLVWVEPVERGIGSCGCDMSSLQI